MAFFPNLVRPLVVTDELPVSGKRGDPEQAPEEYISMSLSSPLESSSMILRDEHLEPCFNTVVLSTSGNCRGALSLVDL